MKEKILSLLMEINEEIGEYEGESMLEDEIITSLEVIEIVSALEDEFGITISAKNISKANFATVDSICEMVESLQ
ncbi:MAG: acyl carrier protein [Parasporobacterium sp.]|nr:acyl carrier protein [Parasporobacterium sp.]